MSHHHPSDIAYAMAREKYATLGVDTDKALETLHNVPISIHCWQGDDVGGFEEPDSSLSGGGIAVTGNFPGKARSIDELRRDLEEVLNLLPGKHRLNLHASYGEFGGKKTERNAIRPDHFQGWIDWAKHSGVKLDFNSTFFSHPLANDGFTLSHRDPAVREFWIAHAGCCRAISEHMGKELNDTVIHNIWIPDGSKDLTVDRFLHRSLLKESLDRIFETKYDRRWVKDSIESKLFGIGSEAFVTGSHEFYLAYGIAGGVMICLDMGHFHPTESVADKISSLLLFSDELMLHVSRGIRWDSDHVVTLSDELLALMQEIVRAGALQRVHIGLDFFDASINRIGAWVVGTRAARKALLMALLEPIEQLRKLEREQRYFERLALLEETRMMPTGAVWDQFCIQNAVPPAGEYIDVIRKHEKAVLLRRGQ